jgi:FG-GAP-like repeat/PASTA domain
VLLNRGDGSFLAKRDYGARRFPASVAIADLNGDGTRDLAIANSGTNNVSVLLNRGDGRFQAKLDYTTGFDPASVAIGDLNGDGKPDLATANELAIANKGEHSASVLLNRGDGTFETKRDYAIGGSGYSVAIGDLNGDGKPDLATANANNSVSVLLNRGDGSFQAKRDSRTGFDPESVAIGDLNGDSKPDLASANNQETVSVFLNRGDSSFHARRDYATGYVPRSVAISDLNGDGKPDLATANYVDGVTGSISVLLNRGDGTFQAKRDYATGAGPYSVAIGDLNGDGERDLATANFGTGNADTVSVLLNRPGLCTMQDVTGNTLQAAKRTLARANCRVGKIRRAYSKTVKRGRVISQKPNFGAVLPGGSKVSLVISRGRNRS